GYSVVAQHRVGAVAADVQVAISAKGQARRLHQLFASRGNEGVDEFPGGSVVAQDRIAPVAVDVQVSVWTKDQPVTRLQESPAAFGNKGIDELAGTSVIP